ncbi:MAG: hypothetical protein M3Q75_12385 [Gemmatimonadota bacterium]|nr:hypothetical protein [Gemmatimonadota bacterium]
MTAVLVYGSQEPRVGNHPPYTTTAGEAAIAWAAANGIVLMPWQQHVLRIMLGEHPDPEVSGRWAAKEVGLLVARQQGKGVVLMVRELFGLLELGEQLTVHTSHLVPTSLEHFRRVKQFIRANPALEAEVLRIREKNGAEAVEFRSGARLLFMARSKGGGRGFSGDVLVLDEAQEMPAAAMEALSSTLLTRPSGQILYAGTVPAQINDCEYWTSIRDRDRAGGDPNLAWLEWSPHPDMRIDDARAVPMSNPSLGYRVTPASIEWQRSMLGPDGFARESLSIWQDQGHLSVLDPDVWAAMTDTTSAPSGAVAISIAVSPERVAYIGVAGARADGLIHLDYGHDERRGLTWVPQKIADLVAARKPCAVILDPAGPAGALIPDLVALKVDVTAVSGRELAAACGMLLDQAEAGNIRHLGQAPLAVALDKTRTRKVGDAWVWDNPTADLGPLYAVTLALYAQAKHGRTKPKTYEVFEF